MKIKIELEKGETIPDSEEFLAKALLAKHECDKGERYSSESLNHLHETLCSEFNSALQDAMLVTEEIIRDDSGTRHS